MSFFGTPLKTYSTVLKNGLKNETVSGPKPKAPTIQGQLPGLSRPMEEVREDVAAHNELNAIYRWSEALPLSTLA